MEKKQSHGIYKARNITATICVAAGLSLAVGFTAPLKEGAGFAGSFRSSMQIIEGLGDNREEVRDGVFAIRFLVKEGSVRATRYPW